MLSVCVPTFERPKLVQRAIESIVQSAEGAEADVEIIVSDNSPDVSEIACRQALESWSGRSLYVGNRPDIGFNDNYNQCIARASGRYVLFVHDDDRLLPGAVSSILGALADGDERDLVLVFGIHVVDEAGRILRRQEFDRDVSIRADAAVRGLLSDNAFNGFPAVVVSHDAYDVVGRFDNSVDHASDLDMWVRLFGRFGARYVPKTISAYSVHSGSATLEMAYDGEAVADLLSVFERAGRSGVLPAETLRRCQALFFHQYILAAAYLQLRLGNVTASREVMALFKLPAVKALGTSLPWLPVRLVFSGILKLPAAVVRLLMALVNRIDPVRWLRAAQSRWRGPSHATWSEPDRLGRPASSAEPTLRR